MRLYKHKQYSLAIEFNGGNWNYGEAGLMFFNPFPVNNNSLKEDEVISESEQNEKKDELVETIERTKRENRTTETENKETAT